MEYQNSDELDLRLIFNFINQNKKLVLSFSLIGTLLCFIIFLFLPRTWKGEFQIVLEQNEKMTINPFTLSSVLNPNAKNQDLNTELEILKSPSVLKDIFEDVKNIKNLTDLRFDSWRNQFKFGFQKQTSVLNISYFDEDKEIIIPILDQVSKTYQDYSDQDRTDDLERSIKYYKKQVEIFTEKSRLTLNNLKSFAYDNDLILPSFDLGKIVSPNILDSESRRVLASDAIKLLKLQLKELKNLEGDFDDVLNFATSLKLINQPTISGLIEQINFIDNELLDLRAIFKEEDKSISNLLEKRKIAIQKLKTNLTKNLEAQIIKTSIDLNSQTKPKEILIRFSELMNEAFRDQKTLNFLQVEYQRVSLENAKSAQPWKLITKPVLLPEPISPRIEFLIIFGILSGILLGIIYSYYLNKKRDIFTSIAEIRQVMDYQIIDIVLKNDINAITNSLDLLLLGRLSQIVGEVSLLSLGEIDKNQVKKLNDYLNKESIKKKFIVARDIKDAIKINNIILIADFSSLKRKEIKDLNKYFSGQSVNIIGLFLYTNSIPKI